MKFSVQKYLLEHNLANKDGDPLPTKDLPVNPSWGLGPYNQWDTMIYLCTLVYIFDQYDTLCNVNIALEEVDDRDFKILIDEINPDHVPQIEWNLVLDTIGFLIPSMAGSNVSYLAAMLFVDN